MRWVVAVGVVLVLGACSGVGPSPATTAVTTTPATTAVAATRPSPKPADPATVVRRFYAAVNDHDYAKAWALGGRNLGGRSFEEFVAGFGDLDHDDLQIVAVRGQLVDVQLVATQDGGTRRTVYAGTYRVVGGEIIHGDLRVVDRSGTGGAGGTDSGAGGGGSTATCDPSYPDFCIPPPPPDLDCADVGADNFTVLPPDPHRFDRDGDGIGCER